MDDFLTGELTVSDLHRVKAGDTARELGAVLIADAYDLVFGEVAFATGDARRKQAAAFFAQSFLRAFVDVKRAFWVVKECDPAFAAGELAGLRDEDRSFFCPA